MNLKKTLRFLIKNRLLSFLSILVLTFGMSSFILIYFYIQYERNYDVLWVDPERIYRVLLEKSMPNGTITTTATNYDGLCRVIKEEIPGVGQATGFQRDIVTAYTPENFLKDVSCFPYITQVLLNRGYKEEAIHKILGGNFLRVFKWQRKKPEVEGHDCCNHCYKMSK